MNIDQEIIQYFKKSELKNIQYLEDNYTYYFILSGSLDLEFAHSLEMLLSNFIENQSSLKNLIVDLKEISYISSTGVGVLSSLLIQATKRNISFKLKDIQPKVKVVFELLGLLSFFEEIKTDE